MEITQYGTNLNLLYRFNLICSNGNNIGLYYNDWQGLVQMNSILVIPRPFNKEFLKKNRWNSNGLKFNFQLASLPLYCILAERGL